MVAEDFLQDPRSGSGSMASNRPGRSSGPCSGDATICCFARERANRDDKDGRPPDEENFGRLRSRWRVLRHTPSALTHAERLRCRSASAYSRQRFQDAINQIPQIDLRCRRHAVCGTQIRNSGSGSYKVHNL